MNLQEVYILRNLDAKCTKDNPCQIDFVTNEKIESIIVEQITPDLFIAYSESHDINRFGEVPSIAVMRLAKYLGDNN